MCAVLSSISYTVGVNAGMSVNTKKTQIVHFRSCSTPKTDHTFTFGAETINVSHKYKYLGLVLTEHLDCDKIASIVAKSAGRAL